MTKPVFPPFSKANAFSIGLAFIDVEMRDAEVVMKHVAVSTKTRRGRSRATIENFIAVVPEVKGRTDALTVVISNEQ